MRAEDGLHRASPTDATWSETAAHACRCGAVHGASHVRVVDLGARSELARTLRRKGPIDGRCPACGRATPAAGSFLEIDPAQRKATLVIAEQRRAHVLDELAAHLDVLRRRPELVFPWTLQPALVFVVFEGEATDEDTKRRMAPEEHRAIESLPSSVVVLEELPAIEVVETVEQPRPRTEPEPSSASTPGVPEPIGRDGMPMTMRRPSGLGTFVTELMLDDELPCVRIELDDALVRSWKEAKVDVRPIHLRGRGYPLVGVRIVGAWMGQLGCIDALVDVADSEAITVFRALSQQFGVALVLDSGIDIERRDLSAPGLEQNASLCVESARGLLAQGELPPGGFVRARGALERESVEERLAQTKITVAPGAYHHIVGATEARAAVDHLDRVSRKETLAHLLEVEGLPMGEYDAIRRRVLAGSLDHGVVVPRRFWRRVVASGLATDLTDYVFKLARNRAAHEGEEGDLDPAEAKAAWEAIHELCLAKDIRPPEALRRALDLPETEPQPARPPARRSAAGEIRVESNEAHAVAEAEAPPGNTRLRAVTELLRSGRAGSQDLETVFEALDVLDTDELLAVLPDLSDLGPRAVPGLVAKLGSERRELRQAAAILLGMSLDPDALGPLTDTLVGETTGVWLDVARALGGFGPMALRRLCQVLRREAGSERDQQAIDRVARAFAEVALSDGAAPRHARPAHDAVAALADAADPRVSTAARRALATLQDVSESGAAIRGEVPFAEVTEIRGFARRAYEAIMVPELEVEAEP